MADIKISQLTISRQASPNDYLVVVAGENNKKILFSDLMQSFTNDVVINKNNGVSKLIVEGSVANTDSLFITDTLNNRVGIKTDKPQRTLHVNGDVQIGVEDGEGNSSGVYITSHESILINDNEVSQTCSSTTEITEIYLNNNSKSQKTLILEHGSSWQIKTFVLTDVSDKQPTITIQPVITVGAPSTSLMQLKKPGTTLNMIYINKGETRRGWMVLSKYEPT